MRSFFEGKVIVISGATDGIGQSLLSILSAWNAKVAVCGKNLEKVAEGRSLFALHSDVYFEVCDVRSSIACKQFIQNTVQHFGRIDIIINNAGISMRSEVLHTMPSVIEDVMNVNFMGMVYLSSHALPYIIESKGSVVGISSIAGYRATPGRAAYSASKFAMNGFLESLRVEMRPHQVHVLSIAPGFIASRIRKKALDGSGAPVGDTTMNEERMMTPDTCALHILHAIKKRKQRVTLSLLGKATIIINKLSPRLADFLVYHFYYKNRRLIK